MLKQLGHWKQPRLLGENPNTAIPTKMEMRFGIGFWAFQIYANIVIHGPRIKFGRKTFSVLVMRKHY